MLSPISASVTTLPRDHGVLRALLTPLSALLADRDVCEVVVNKPGEVWVEARGGWRVVAVPGVTHAHLEMVAATIASSTGQAVNAQKPLLSAVLPDGERVQVVVPPAVGAGLISLTIRKPSAVSLSLAELSAGGLFAGIGAEAAARGETDARMRGLHQDLHIEGNCREFLRLAVLARRNIIISGATGSGKTTLSKALIELIPETERIITIEDTAELVVPQRNHVRLYYSKGDQGVSKVGPRELLEACLRMRPDRILLQELRDGTAFQYLRNVNSGHPGSITTVHADSARLAFEQLTLLVKESEGGRDLGRDDIRGLLTMLVDIVVQCKRVEGRFAVTEIHYADRRGLRVTDEPHPPLSQAA